MMNVLDVNQTILERFDLLESAGKLAHAYLFVGPRGSGKAQTALEIAKLIQCEARNKHQSCGVCSSCIKFASGNHPDVHTIERQDSEFIKIEQVRDLLDQIRLRPFLGRKKIFIIKDVEFLTEEGGNALLKTLEEPSVNSLLLLTTSVAERVLETIKSRCHTIAVAVMPKDSLAQHLKNVYNANTSEAHVLAYYSEGCLGKAVSLKEDFIKRRNDVLDHFVFSSWNEAFVKETLADKLRARELLDVLFSFVHDVYLVKADVEDKRFVHRDRYQDIVRFADRFSVEELSQLKIEILNMYKLLAENLNIKMPLLIIKERIHG
jgi:DNA polymerase-3 subunit delta'